eukprot:RCo029736
MVHSCVAGSFTSSDEDSTPIFAPVTVVRYVNVTTTTHVGGNGTAANGTTNGTTTALVANYSTVMRPKWLWQSGEQLCSQQTNRVTKRYCTSLVIGVNDVVYPSGGYVVVLPPSSYFTDLQQWAVNGTTSSNTTTTGAASAMPKKWEYINRTLDEMEYLGFLGDRTVFVAVEFTIYNANVRLLATCMVMFEFLPTGEVLASANFQPLSLLGLDTLTEKVVLTLECLLAILVGVYLYDKGVEMFRYFAVKPVDCIVCDINKIRQLGLAHVVVCRMCMRDYNPFVIGYCPDCQLDIPKRHLCWKGFFEELWNFFDIWNLVTFTAVIVYRFVLRLDMIQMEMGSAASVDSQFLNFFPLGWQVALIGALDAINMLLCFVKSLKYLSRIRGMHVLIRTLQYSFAELCFFILTWGVFYVGFALAFVLALGVSDAHFRTWDLSLVHVFLAMLGELDYSAMYFANRILAPFMLALFYLWMGLISFYMFVAILDSNYVRANNEEAKANQDFLYSSLAVLLKGWRDRLGFCLGARKGIDHLGHQLLARVDRIPGLSKNHKKELLLFRKQMTENPDVKLLGALLKTFPDYLTRNFTREDYTTLQRVVRR